MKKVNLKVFLLCPIPDDQKPINEYVEWKNNKFANWTILPDSSFFQTPLKITLLIFLAIELFTFESYPFSHFPMTLILASLIMLISILLLSNRWENIKKRFIKSRLFYEEASWFDGQIWEKPVYILRNDKLIANQKIEPIIQRLIHLFYIIAVSSIVSISFIEIFLFLYYN